MNPTRLMNRRGEYRVRRLTNAADAESPAVTEILIYDEIGYDPWFDTGVAAKTIVETLNDTTGDVHVRLNSPGGDVFEGIAMMNALRRYDGKVTAFVDGLAASAASIVAMGADELVMARQSELMIHDAWGIGIGNADEMQQLADDLSRASDNLASAYADKAGGSVASWRKAMKAETWYSDKEAVAAGLADRVEQSKTVSDKAKARFNLSLFAYAGRAEAPEPYLPAEPENPSTREESAMSDTLIEGLRARLGLNADADEAAVLAAVDASVAPDNDPDPDEADDETEAEDAEDSDDADESTPGTVSIDEGILNQLRADAEAGREARAQQLAEHRESLVNSAIREGRISVARKADWLNKLEKDAGSETELAGLAKGLVPVDAPHGYAGSLSDVAEDNGDAIYNKLFGEAV
jgi:ATP-dependent protease ClpP protease subunit